MKVLKRCRVCALSRGLADESGARVTCWVPCCVVTPGCVLKPDCERTCHGTHGLSPGWRPVIRCPGTLLMRVTATRIRGTVRAGCAQYHWSYAVYAGLSPKYHKNLRLRIPPGYCVSPEYHL